MLSITLKGGAVKELEAGKNGFDLLAILPQQLKKEALAMKVDGEVCDLASVLHDGAQVEFLTFGDEEGRWALRHTASHMLAQAVKKLFPEAKLAIGPAIDNGFYYDFDIEKPFTPEDLPKIEKEMERIAAANHKLERSSLPREAALKWADEAGEPYKRELIEELPEDEEISFYRQGDFVDLCAGPHVPSTGRVKALKLTSVAGAYWRGSEKNKMLCRIYGTAFEKQAELKEHLERIEEARKRDHRILGRDLDLFTIDEAVGPGLVLWHPKLSIVREEIELYWRKQHRKRGYEYVYTPNIGMSNLWETSGHLKSFADGMYPPMSMALKDKDEQNSYYIKPMNCPFHIRVYKSRPRSYRDLPIRWCELGNVYRYEKSGTLHGMMRVRGFTQDDAHIFCREDQFVDEINRILDFAIDLNKDFGFDSLRVYLSIRGAEDRDKYIGDERIWDNAEKTLNEILTERGIDFKVDVGGAKFYGPAVDLKAVDAMGREWQGTTIQLDMNEPARFGVTYIGQDGQEHTPIMLHRTLLGSMERFVGTLIEHYGGAFPLWLAPVQVKILTITDRADAWARELESMMLERDIRAKVDLRNEKIGFKIREAQVEKTPYMLVIGDKEVEARTAAVRSRKGGDMGVLEPEAFISDILKEIESKAIK